VTTRPTPTAPPSWIVGPQWAQLRLRQPGWLILPLRGFLGVTFVYAALQKLANPAYLDPHNSASVVGQMQSLRHTSPIGPLLAASLHAPTLVGLLIAFGELAVGTGALLGLWTRHAALGGMALALTFFLTVSWSTTPYYYGSDIVFVFAWSVLAAFGAGGVLSVDAWIGSRARRLGGLGGPESTFVVDAARLHALCDASRNCGLRPDSGCDRSVDCPLFGADKRERTQRAAIEQRRSILTLQAFAAVAVGALGVGGATALLGRLAGGTKHNSRQNTLPTGGPAPSPSASKSPKPKRSTNQPAQQPKHLPGTAITSTSSLSVGQAGQFTDPKSGSPAWLVHLSSTKFVAYSAVCTHAGCTVSFDGNAMEFVCPCHGGTYDAKTGAVTAGPPPSPLPPIPVHVINGQVRVD
jgi:thiosulfate dehydrogenase [quinone] large subunit